jgi:tRNA (adenine37-N6)-methyltransferase
VSERTVIYHPIGVVRSDHVEAGRTPVQPVYAPGCRGTVEVFQEYAEGLRDLEGFSHIYLIYHFHRSEPGALIVKPFLDDTDRGVFSTRAPSRPNPIGLSVVELISREGNILHVNNVDILDGTPVLDIKPYAARFDRIETTRNGWHDGIDDETARQRGKRGFTARPEGRAP